MFFFLIYNKMVLKSLFQYNVQRHGMFVCGEGWKSSATKFIFWNISAISEYIIIVLGNLICSEEHKDAYRGNSILRFPEKGRELLIFWARY